MLRSWMRRSARAPRGRIYFGSTLVVRTKSVHTSRSSPALEALDKENPRLLAAVDKRIRERKILARQSTLDVEQSKQLKSLDRFYKVWCDWQEIRKSLVETIDLLKDEDHAIRELAEEEYENLLSEHNRLLNEKLPSLLVPQSTTEDISALVEIKPGVGGSESSLFLEELLRMYSRYANLRGWNSKVIATEAREGGGMKNAILEVDGEGAYDGLRWESGVHRVQRVPTTETAGRVHTSTVQVLILPLTKEDPGTSDEKDLLDERDIKIEVMRARGAGGQHVNKTESAVRLTHIPTGITVSMQDERSQHMNKARAFKVLRARLLDRKLQAEVTERRDTRRKLVKSADRSEKIRTYNFAQDRVTDHRIGMTVKNIASVLDGDGLQDIINAIQTNHRHEFIEEMLEND